MQDYNTVQKTRFYAPELDGLRFVAALLVFIHHAPEIWPFGFIKSYGWVGVDLFLTISAFLITRLILIEHDITGSFNIRAFFIRRALRIWPLFLSYVSFISMYAVIAGSVEWQVVLAWWLSHISFTNNIVTAIHGYSPVLFSAHLWTISLEEQAYIIIPILLMAFISCGRNKKLAALVCVGLISILLISRVALVILNTPHPFIWVSPLRADAFIIGSLGAILFAAQPKGSLGMLVLGVVLMFSLAFFKNIDINGPGQIFGYTLVALGCLLIVLGVQARNFVNHLLSCRVARFLGKVSYGIYVFHLAAIGIAGKFGFDAALTFYLGLALTIVLASVSYFILERPFLILKERYAKVRSRPL